MSAFDYALVLPEMATRAFQRAIAARTVAPHADALRAVAPRAIAPRGQVGRRGDEPAAQIFINYRNEDEPFGAALIDHALSIRFGEGRVFCAAKSIRLGEDFADALMNGVRRSSVLLVIIGRRWSPDTGATGQAANSVDWVRYEIAEAFRQGVRVVPVLLNVDPPVEAILPPDIAPLARCQYIRIRHRHSQHDIEYLARELAALVPGLPARSTAAGVDRRLVLDHSVAVTVSIRRSA